MHATGSARVRAALLELGLDRFHGYVAARAASLGVPARATVVAAFGVFEPSHLGRAYDTARARCGREVLLETRTAATVASLHEVLVDQDVDQDVGEVVGALRRAVSVAPREGRPLFAGLADQDWPHDPVGQLWRACELLREHRGDTHLTVCRGAGLDPVQMNVLTELWHDLPSGSVARTRGWGGAAIGKAMARLAEQGLVRCGRLTPAGSVLRTGVEDATNHGERGLVGALGADLESVVSAVAVWSDACVRAGTFCADSGKRATG